MRPLLPALLATVICACGAERAADTDARARAETGAQSGGPATPPAPPATHTPARTLPVAGTVPARFQGTYAADSAACGSAGHESRLTIAEREIRFHESSGPVAEVSSTGSEITIEATLTGEGETFERSYTYRLSDDGDILTDTDGGMSRQRCG